MLFDPEHERRARPKYLQNKFLKDSIEHIRYVRLLDPSSRQTRIHIGHHNIGGPHTHGSLAPSHVVEKLGGLIDPTKLVDTVFDTNYHDKMVDGWHKAERDIKQVLKDPKDLALFIVTGGASVYTKWSAEILAEAFKPVFELLGFKDKDIVSTSLSVQAFYDEEKAFNADRDWVLKEALGNKEYAEAIKRIAIWGENGNPVNYARKAQELGIPAPVRTFFISPFDMVTELQDLHKAYPTLNQNFSVITVIRGILNPYALCYLELSKDPKFDLAGGTYDGVSIDSVVSTVTNNVGTAVLTMGSTTKTIHFRQNTTVWSLFWIKLNEDIVIPPFAQPLPTGRELLVSIDHAIPKLEADTSTKPDSENLPLLFVKQDSGYLSEADLKAKHFDTLAETLQLPLDELTPKDKSNPSAKDITTIAYGCFVGLWEENDKIQESVGKYCYEYFEQLVPLYGISPLVVIVEKIHIRVNYMAYRDHVSNITIQVMAEAKTGADDPFLLTLVSGVPLYDKIVKPYLAGTTDASWDKPYEILPDPTAPKHLNLETGTVSYRTSKVFNATYTNIENLSGKWLDDLILAILTSVRQPKPHTTTHHNDGHGGHQADHDNRIGGSISLGNVLSAFDTSHYSNVGKPDPTHIYKFKPETAGAKENITLKKFFAAKADGLMTKVKTFHISQGDFVQVHNYTGLVSEQINVQGGVGAYSITYGEDNNLILTKQVTPSIQSKITVYKYAQSHILQIEGFYGIATAAYNRKQFMLPIDMVIFRQLDLFAQEEIAARCRFKVVYGGTHQHLKYYQTPQFIKFVQVVVEIVSIILIIVSGGGLAAPLEVLKSLLIAYAVGKVTSYALKEIAEHIGDKNLRIALSILVSVAGAAAGAGAMGGMGAIQSVDGAMRMLDAGLSGYNQMMQYEFAAEEDKFEAELRDQEDDNDRLKKLAREDNLDFGKTHAERTEDAVSDTIVDSLRSRANLEVEDFDEFYDRIHLDLSDIMSAWEEIHY